MKASKYVFLQYVIISQSKRSVNFDHNSSFIHSDLHSKPGLLKKRQLHLLVHSHLHSKTGDFHFQERPIAAHGMSGLLYFLTISGCLFIMGGILFFCCHLASLHSSRGPAISPLYRPQHRHALLRDLGRFYRAFKNRESRLLSRSGPFKNVLNVLFG